MHLGEAFNPKANGLNLIRLILASSVVVWHSFPLTGRTVGNDAVRQFLSDVPVDGFFAVSGFLIAGSWLRRPGAGEFLRARALRIFPAFWTCLIVTAAALAPIGIRLGGSALPDGYLGSALKYVFGNATLHMRQWGIAGSPTDVPHPGAWDGSLWTLEWEFLCYLGILALGVAGLLARRGVIAILFASATLASLIVAVGGIDNFYVDSTTRFGLMFLAGTLVYVLQDYLPRQPMLLAAAVAVVLLAQMLPDYRIVGSFFLAYALIATGSYLTSVRLRFRNDVSYGMYIYAFPVQQILAGTDAINLPVPVFAATALALTAPLAIASWFLVERPALRLKGIRRPKDVQEAVVAA